MIGDQRRTGGAHLTATDHRHVHHFRQTASQGLRIRIDNESGAAGLGIGSGGGINRPFGQSVTLVDNQTLDVSTTTTIEAAGTLNLSGGTLTTGALNNTAGGAFVATGSLGRSKWWRARALG